MKLPVLGIFLKKIQIIQSLFGFAYQPGHAIAIFKTGDPGRWPSLTFLALKKKRGGPA